MPPPSVLHDYEIKPERYFQQQRPEMLDFIPREAAAILDVGCSDGLFGRSLKQRQPCEVWGVEMMAASAALASQQLDRVFATTFDESLPLPRSHFDCIIFNDCLEHMEQPETALALCRQLLKPGGVVVASIPNMRYYPVMRDLLVYGQWEYADSGVMDRTHLRFFTRKSIAALFARNHYAVERLEGINPYHWGKGRVHRLLNALLLGKIGDMKFQQFAAVARLRP